MITAEGEEKTLNTGIADTFYFYNRSVSKPIHKTDYTLWINSKPIDTWLNPIPSYRKDHIYTFKISVPKGQLSFGIGKGFITDKVGYLTVTISEESREEYRAGFHPFL